MNGTLLTILVLLTGASALVVWLSVSASSGACGTGAPAPLRRVLWMTLLFGGVAAAAWLGGFDWMFPVAP